ncbi:hypothetical protein D9M71_505090 [compost metagenome]
MPGVRTVRPARGHVVGQQLRRGVRSLFAFAQNHRSLDTLPQFIQTQQRTRVWQTLPTPLLRLTVGTLAPSQGSKHLAQFAVFIWAQVEAIERHDWLALSIAIYPDFGRRTVLPVFGRTFVHDLGRDRLNGKPFRCFAFAGFRLRLHGPSGNAQQVRQLVTGLDVGAAIQIAHQIDQIAAFVAGGKIRPGAFAQVDLEGTGALVGAG